MSGLLKGVDPEGLLEYSVVYTDRALNHMSLSFQGVMNEISSTLKEVYNAEGVVVVPGSGTFAMEAVARQFATDSRCLVIQNGWFSYRWSQIFDAGDIPSSATVLKAASDSSDEEAPFSPPPIEQVVETIRVERPEVLFAPHVETASGMILTNDYIKRLADAIHQVGGIFVLDGIASGAIWVDMRKSGVDLLISAPQKGWSSSPCCGLVMMSALAVELLEQRKSTSFACDLGKWREIMRAYEAGGHAYHATMPTDGLTRFRNAMRETVEFGQTRAMIAQQALGDRVRELLESRGFKSVAASPFKAPGVVVSYTRDDKIHTGQRFAEIGLQIAAGVPLQCDEPEGFKTFRLGLFGLDKLMNVDRTVSTLESALNRLD